MNNRQLTCVVVMGIGLGCGGTEPPPPVRRADRISVAQGNNQTATTGSPLPVQIVFTAGDAQGPLSGVSVSFALSDSSGTISKASDTTRADGSVTVSWTVGGQLGVQRLTGSITGANAVAQASVAVGSVAQLAPLTSPSQFVVVGRPVANLPAIRAQDQFGNPVGGHTVSFIDGSGRSQLVGAATVTDASGTAALQGWRIGAAAGAYLVQARDDVGISTNFVAFGIPAEVSIFGGAGQTANAGTTVADPIAVKALGDQGDPLADVTVAFTVAGGGGRLLGTGQAKTNAAGVAIAPSWVLGPTPGSNTLNAEVAGLPPVGFNAIGVAGVPASVQTLTSTSQTGLAGNVATTRPTVLIRDAAGRPVAGAAIVFSLGAGGGTITGASPVSDFMGTAAIGSWRFGPAGPQSLSGQVGSLPPVTFAATAAAAPPTGFAIQVRFTGPAPTPSQQAAFDSAAAKWGRLILGDLEDTPITPADDAACGNQLNETVDDILILASIQAIDGPGRVLGRAGLCSIRVPENLALIGVMQFDVDDVVALETNDRFRDVVLHEMGHVLGVGSLWSFKELIVGVGTGNPVFIGGSAQMAFNTAALAGFAGNPVPVEATGGPGTANVHWRESTLINELMTGFLNQGTVNPLSAITAASLRDEGYLVNDAESDTFSFGSTVQAALRLPVDWHLTWLRRPVRGVDRHGVVRRSVDLSPGPFR